MYMFLAGLGLLVIVGLHQLLESRKVSGAPCVLLVAQALLYREEGEVAISCGVQWYGWNFRRCTLRIRIVRVTGLIYRSFKTRTEDLVGFLPGALYESSLP